MKKHSIKDIAQLSGVSVATVSRVINNNGRFSEETRRKVLQVIEETGYHTNYNAKGLRMKRSYAIGIIVPDITNYFFAKLIENIEGLLFEKGYSAIICNTARNSQKEKSYLAMLENKGVDGMIIISGAEIFSFPSHEGKTPPYICIDREPESLSDTVFISSDHKDGAVQAANFLFDSGCRQPLILTHSLLTQTGQKRLQGFIQALADHQLDFQEQLNHISLDRDNPAAYDQAARFLTSHPEIDGIFAINDLLAIEIQNVIIQTGLNKRHYKIVGFDDSPMVSLTAPKISSIRQDIPKLAEISVEKILQLLQGSNDLGKMFSVPVQLIKR
ncbi:LacI family transcriptional regulator [Streptococcus chenjunshii]|uniref:LacI family transcriptional regulator n=1 Tax=Streptococcus chenjunshii TaxID=2173853 RepID=A0A372KL28_9STRE|nr:LacI family DNA-binding transcriptional regulator [Streptococcus chenjunshii]AXQ79210.1 LacI family transcriptional regulator [Streptococcus chenjunshii]RFU50782.1 LacI family transcriptional regulator [Streptococcus chenjunshii]RFU52963.1 LacI family transcriptional regulator [Streptococcus chenjunshii]